MPSKDLDIALEGVDLVCFDLFGTLVEILDRRRPHRHLLSGIDAEERTGWRRRVMTEELRLSDLASLRASGSGAADRAKDDLDAELRSIRLRPGIAELLDAITERGIDIAICSNLSADNTIALEVDHRLGRAHEVLSWRVGAIKPDKAIYRSVCELSGVQSGRVLFTGDTPEADLSGPRLAGMRAVEINVFQGYLAGVTPCWREVDDKGGKAFMSYDPIVSNPYADGTPAHAAWAQAWEYLKLEAQYT